MRIREKLKRNALLIESVLSLSILKGLNILLPLVTLPYILRIVGAANYGSYSYIYVLIQYLLLFTSYGFNYSTTKQISQNRDNNALINEIFNSVIIARLLLLVVGVALFWALSFFLLKTIPEKEMFLMGLGIIIGDILTPVWLFQGMEKMKYLTLANIVTKFIFTILIFIFIRNASDYVYIILFNSLGFILSGVISLLIAKRQFNISFLIPSYKSLKYQFKEGFQLFISSVGINLYSNANILVLKFFVDETSLGIYSAIDKIIKGLKTLGSPISQALFPHLGYRFRNQSYASSLIQLKKASWSFSFLLLFISAATLIFSEKIILLFGGKEYISGIILLRIMSPTILLGGLNSLLGFSGLVNLNRAKEFTKGVIFSGFISLVILILLLPIYGVNVAAWVSTFSELLLLLFIMTALYKIKESEKNFN